ncbi:recombinase family protein [Actinoallomurus sp. NBC_01490]|uniref:recombinase family protein n=1 Tax=Actinoallomurus sp. NBC_01490 TaxID=2903557 RepID=UPI002E2EC424|nr:recombinase family protein [Actinoallomurus sp. NBC_01490]
MTSAALPEGPLLEGSLGENPLAAEPAASMGALIGYARVSTGGQRLDPQTHALTEAGCIRIFADKKSGKNVEREQLWKALDYLRAGDTLVVPSLDRLGRALQDLIAIVAGLRKRGIGFRSLHEALDTTTPGGRLVFHVFAALAEFIRELIVEDTHEGLAAARAPNSSLAPRPLASSCPPADRDDPYLAPRRSFGSPGPTRTVPPMVSDHVVADSAAWFEGEGHSGLKDHVGRRCSATSPPGSSSPPGRRKTTTIGWRLDDANAG